MGDGKKKEQKKPYEKPTATRLTREEAKMKLIGQAMMGDEEAERLLEALFTDDAEHKKSA